MLFFFEKGPSFSLKTILVYIFLCLSFAAISQNEIKNIPFKKVVFIKGTEYHYRALYIDSQNDTVTNEILELKILGRRWFVQPGLQEAIRYIYNTDTSEYKKYVDPHPHFKKRNEKKLRISEKETTGGYANASTFYLHPPRTNQYRMLFYAPHPLVPYQLLQDTLCTFVFKRRIIGMPFKQTYQYSPGEIYTANNRTYRSWNVHVDSDGDLDEHSEALRIYDSKLTACFCEEIGFIELKYTFENGIIIHFKLEKIKYNK